MSADRVEGELLFDGVPGWSLAGATWTERLNQPYRATARIEHAEREASALPMLGESVELVLRRRGVEERLAGIVTEVRDGLASDTGAHAVLVIEPALRALAHKKDTRVFQNVTVPDILQQVLGADLGAFGRTMSNELARTYSPREYTVQYDETDFDFAHRLMEEEGIVYYFRHEGGPELLALTDATSQHVTMESETGRSLTFTQRMDASLAHTEAVFALEPTGRITGTRVSVRAFDWTHPSMIMEGSAEGVTEGAVLESYEVRPTVTMGGFSDTGYASNDAAQQAQLLSELQMRDRSLAAGASSSIALRSGARLNLDGHPQPDHNREYLAVSVEHRFRMSEGSVDEARTAGLDYENEFTLIPADVQWRPDRLRDRPRIAGVQTATVVGPAGEEIHTDPHGRVMVQFHWDRLGQRDEHSSCWIRVMQSMGGPGWGFTFVPRIGQEVVVTFVDGDPDQPIVTGAIFNGENPIPLDYPADKTRMTIKSSSSPGGAGFNELRFEDAAGSEEIWLHGQKDWNTLIKHDLNRTVENDESQEVAQNRTRMVGLNETVTIGVSQTRMVGVDKSETVGNNRTRLVQNSESVTVGVDRNKVIGQNETVQIGGEAQQSVGKSLAQTIGQNMMQSVELNAVQTIGAAQTVSVGASSTTNVVVDSALNVGGQASVTTGKSLLQKVGDSLIRRVKLNATETVGANRSSSVTLNDTLSVGTARTASIGASDTTTVAGESALTAQTITQTAEGITQIGAEVLVNGTDKVTLSVGDAELTMEKSGKISLKGVDITIESGDGKIHIDGGGIIKLNGPMVKINT